MNLFKSIAIRWCLSFLQKEDKQTFIIEGNRLQIYYGHEPLHKAAHFGG